MSGEDFSNSASLEEIFQSFCAFGGGIKEPQPLMDGAKFSKFCRDTKLLDKKLTSIDVDIIFAQVKQKTERKINFDQFKEALKLMAEKKYYPERNPMPMMVAKILEGKGPSVSGTTFDSWKRIWNMHKTRYCKVQYKLKMAEWYNLNDHAVRSGARPNPRTLRERVLNPYPTRVHKEEVHKSLHMDAVDRMTDTSRYTGTHKERFDSMGKGKGLEGRDSQAKGQGSIPSLTSQQPAYVGGYKNEGTYDSPRQAKKRDTSMADSVTERLTDTTKYTGSHKHRFDESGRGRGMAGRELPMKGPGMSHGSVSSQAAYVSGYKNEGSYGKN